MEKRENLKPHVEFHADDYGLFPAQSRRIQNCWEHGRLNGISVMPNSPFLAQTMEALPTGEGRPAVTVHLNLVEGKAAGQDVPDLTDSQGNLNCSFGSLLIKSFLPGRKKLRQQLRRELKAQIQAVEACCADPLRLDGHAHYHMLPVVFDALMDVIREENLPVTYIRLPREFVGLYWKHLGRLHDFAPINLVKVAILNLLVVRNRLKYGKFLDTLEQRLFLGVFLSGRMYRDNVELVMEDALNLARKKGWDVEILAHPGAVLEPEDIGMLTNRDDVAFLTSPLRDREATLFLTGEGNGL